MDKVYTGSCLCGAVRFETPDLSDIWYCHCKQCQKLTGLYISAAGSPRDKLKIDGPVNWLPISDKSNSGHCLNCGCYMFWDRQGSTSISVLTGCLDHTNGLKVKGHIYVADKADHYDISDGLPQYSGYPSEAMRQTQ